MIIKPIKTEKILPKSLTLESFLNRFVPTLEDRSIIAITSKVVSLCEGNAFLISGNNKHLLIENEAEQFLPPSKSKYDVMLTIKNNQLCPSAGIDESNGNGYFVLLPKNPQHSANTARDFLFRKNPEKIIGVIITDSKTIPLKWGTIGTAISHSGFLAVNDKIGTPDVFGRKMTMTKVNVADALAAAAVVVMGETNEQTPLVIITDIPFVSFQNRNPTDEELSNLRIPIEDDIYAPLLRSVDWKTKK